MRAERYCVIDVETTGFSPAADRVVEIGCAEVEGDQIVARWSTLVNPGRAIPAEATAVHGITDAMVARAPSLKPALKYARRLCRGRIVAAHSARFDLSFVGPWVAAEALCTMRLARTLFPEAPNYKNQTLRQFLDIDDRAGESFSAHRALGDALVTAHILIACRRRFAAVRGGESWKQFVKEHALVVRCGQS
jgi:DNA polymerase III epsilon subunit family exonuclease